MSVRLEKLRQNIENVLGERAASCVQDRGELTMEVGAADYLAVARLLRDHPDLPSSS